MQRRLWLLLGVLIIVVLAGSWITLKQFTPAGMNNPFNMISWYVRKSANLQAYLTEHASGWMQKIFDGTPEWTHIPLMVSYGVFRPFLPAAIVAKSQSAIWPWITIWRSIGWTFLLALLLYAPWPAIIKQKYFTIALIVVIWAGILIASFRGGADQSDNPRYRAAFAGLQSAVAAWVWIEENRSESKRLRRAMIGAVIVFAWFIPWYLRRYTRMPWPVEDPFITLGLGIASAGLFWLVDLARTKRHRAHSGKPPDIDGAPPE